MIRRTIKLTIRNKHGATLYDQLISAQRQSGFVHEDLKPIKYPPEAEYLIDLFYDLSEGRQSGMSGGMPLSWTDIQHYLLLTDQPLEPFEVNIIRALDKQHLAAVEEYRDKE